jgi:hypothetical protein
MGAVVALHAAAMLPSERIAGVAAFSGWSPFRDGGGNGSACNAGVGGAGADNAPGRQLNQQLYKTHALLPRLGFFEGNEAAVPYDYDELIAAIAPRPTLLYVGYHCKT